MKLIMENWRHYLTEQVRLGKPAPQVVDHGDFPPEEEETALLKIKDPKEYWKRLYELVEHVLVQAYKSKGSSYVLFGRGAADSTGRMWKIPLTPRAGMRGHHNNIAAKWNEEFFENLGLAGKPAHPRVLRKLEILKKEGFAICRTRGPDACQEKNNSLGLGTCLIDIRKIAGNWRIRVILSSRGAAWRKS